MLIFNSYNFDLNNFTTDEELYKSTIFTTSLGPCPPFPVYKSHHVMNRCVPEELNNQTLPLIYNIYGMMNDWDFTEEILNDLYKTWPQMLYYTILSFGKNMRNNYCSLKYNKVSY